MKKKTFALFCLCTHQVCVVAFTEMHTYLSYRELSYYECICKQGTRRQNIAATVALASSYFYVHFGTQCYFSVIWHYRLCCVAGLLHINVSRTSAQSKYGLLTCLPSACNTASSWLKRSMRSHLKAPFGALKPRCLTRLVSHCSGT